MYPLRQGVLDMTKKRVGRDVESIRHLNVAVTLLSGGVRPTNVEAITRLPKATLSELWREMYGRPAKGQTPTFAYTFMRSMDMNKSCSLFATLYRNIAGNVTGDATSLADVETFIRSYERYRNMAGSGAVLTMEQAYYVWRDLRKGFIHLKQCNRCGAAYLYSTHYEATGYVRKCQYCITVGRVKRRLMRIPKKEPHVVIVSEKNSTVVSL